MPLVNNPTIIPGPAGQIEAMISPSADPEAHTIGIICHPHPLYGGAMNNKVVTTLARVFHELGLDAIRFNFRGVGQSEGSYGAGIGETEDLLAVYAWVRQHFPDKSVWLAGFSFGCYVAMRVAVREEVKQLVTIAPAVNHLSFAEADQVRCPWLLVMGEADEVVPVSEVKAWLQGLSIPVQCIFLPEVTHFFHGHLSLLSENLKQALQDRI